ncbi:MAG: catalase [Tissierellia bacterium]|nr:catalase [Tissierellia bacterium]
MDNKKASKKDVDKNLKQKQLENHKVINDGEFMTTNQGLKVSEDEMSLKAGTRGPTIMDDFHFREKMTHFDHERIPERIVHARGQGAHGIFESYQDLSEITMADFLSEKGKRTPLFCRFSTVAGSRGSADTVRDARGWAVKFYTQKGNYDLVSNNMPVFFIHDGIKFPDFVHAVKPEPHNEIPQAASAHDTFWDFITQNQEAAHMVMWAMSDRAIPRSLRMMEGFGVHTYRMVNKQGKSRFVKFHWKPLLGTHSLVWDEAQKINGKNPDFHRQDLWDSIEMGNYPEYELGIQILENEDEFKFDFDILDATKLWPEELVPVKIIGKMILNKNPDNFFAETEQVAFHPGHVVPGIDFTNDPLLQGRLFSYTDTQLIRLGGPNFHEIPINRPIVAIHNNQRDGYNRQDINIGQTSYHRNGLNGNYPRTASPEEGGYHHYEEKVEGYKIRARSDSFDDHFTQAIMFYNSLSKPEQKHLRDAFSFEVSKCKSEMVQKNTIEMFNNVDHDIARDIAMAVGLPVPKKKEIKVGLKSPALSQENTRKSYKTRKIMAILSEGFDEKYVDLIKELKSSGVQVEVLSTHLGEIKSSGEKTVKAEQTLLTGHPVLYDALYVIGGKKQDKEFESKTEEFLMEAFKHYKPVFLAKEKSSLFKKAKLGEPGVLVDDTENNIEKILEMLSNHRFWDRKIY